MQSALILAAGRGERMRPLTDSCPKPLLAVHGKPLMQWPIEALARAGVQGLVVNTAWLGGQIAACFGDHFTQQSPDLVSSHGAPTDIKAKSTAAPVRITYSDEGRDFGGALETAGGIVRALPMLADTFWVLAGDVYAPGFSFSSQAVDAFHVSGKLAHLWLVPNPPHNPNGDFVLGEDGLARNDGEARLTYSTIGLYRRALFAPPYCDIPAGNPEGIKASLAPILRKAIAQEQVSAELYTGMWVDVGTPERLAELNRTPMP